MNVEVDAAPQEDLVAVIAGIREQYESVAAKNQKELQAWFQDKVTDKNPLSPVAPQTRGNLQEQV